MTAPAAVVARHDWTLLIRSGVVVTMVACFVTLATVAIAVGAQRVSRERLDAAMLSHATRDDAAASRGVAYLALERGTFALAPPAPLGGMAIGQSDVYPNHYRITARLADAQLTGDRLEHPLSLLAGQLDLAFVILYLFPLLILAASHDLIDSDRASGTLRMLLVQGASARGIVSGRVRTRLWLVVLLPVAAATAATLASDASVLFTSRFAAWTLASILYGVLWLGIAVHVNHRGQSAASNALLLAAVWLLLVVLVPAVVNLATRTLHPVPSRVQLATALRDASRTAVAEGSRTLGRYLEDHPSAGAGVEGMRQFYQLQELRDTAVARQVKPVMDDFERQVERQRALAGVLQFASPTLIGQVVLTDIAGTSGDRSQWFAAQAAAFQQRWRDHFPADVLAEAAPAAGPPPAFSFVEEPFTRVAQRTALPLGVLAGTGLALLWTGVRRFERYDVTGR